MDSSFLTVIHVGIGLYALVNAGKLIIQFGLPNHPLRFISYIVSLSVAAYWVGLALTDLSFFSAWAWMKWRTLPLVLGGLCLLFQVITTVANFSVIQQKVVSRLPVIGALLCFAIFQEQANIFAGAFLVLGALFFIISVGKARYEKRQYFKMLLILGISVGLRSMELYWAYLLGETLMFLVLFYFFIFQQATAVSSLVDEFRESSEGGVA